MGKLDMLRKNSPVAAFLSNMDVEENQNTEMKKEAETKKETIVEKKVDIKKEIKNIETTKVKKEISNVEPVNMKTDKTVRVPVYDMKDFAKEIRNEMVQKQSPKNANEKKENEEQKVCSYSLRNDIAEKLRRECFENRTTANLVFKDAIDNFVKQDRTINWNERKKESGTAKTYRISKETYKKIKRISFEEDINASVLLNCVFENYYNM